MKVFISEDQTAIIKNVRYESKTNQMVVFVSTLCRENGFPVANNFFVQSFRDIEQAFARSNMSNNAYVFTAQPLQDEIPVFCLTIFGSIVLIMKMSCADGNTWRTKLKNMELKFYVLLQMEIRVVSHL